MTLESFNAAKHASLLSGFPRTVDGLTLRIVDWENDLKEISDYIVDGDTVLSQYGMRPAESDGLTLIAEKHGCAIGHISADLDLEINARMDLLLHLEGVFVAPEFRGEGIATRLSDALLHVAEKFRRTAASREGLVLAGDISVMADTLPGTAGQKIEQRLEFCADKIANAAMDVLVLVHPGSLCGSARSEIGKYEADAVREEILYEVAHHSGAFIVIDGMFSDELSDAENKVIIDALQRAGDAGHVALRLWGCDAGETPYPAWQSFGLRGRNVTFEGQEEAARFISGLLDGASVTVTGAWATPDHSSGCASSVYTVLADAVAGPLEVHMSDSVLMEPDDFAPEL